MVSRAQYAEDPGMRVDPATLEPYVEPKEVEEDAYDLLSLLDDGNIVDLIPDPTQCASDILNDYEYAYNSMSDWREQYKEALKLSKLEPKAKKKTFPFEGASTAMLPFIMEAMLDFNARSAPELAFSKNIVGARVFGESNEAKEDRAKRLAEYVNYQLTELMPMWRTQQDMNLLALPCVGTTYKETYFDSDKQEVCSDLLLGDEIVFDQGYRSFQECPDKFRKLDYTKNELIPLIRGAQQWDMDEDDIDEEGKEIFIKAYTWLDLDDDGLEEPYCVYVWQKHSKPVYMRPLFDEDTVTFYEGAVIKVEMINILTPYHFMPDPAGGPMGLGWGILLGSMFKAINTNLRQQIDAGTLATTAANSGFINADTTSPRGNAVQSGPIKVKMGQFTLIHNRGSGNLAQNIVQAPFAGPNTVMFQLLEYLSKTARSMVVASTDAQASSNEAASLYLARLQQDLKRPNVIMMRVHECAKHEMAIIFELNYKHFSDEKYNRIIDSDAQYSMQSDFNPDDCDVRLTADPSQGSDMERAARANATLQEAKEQPSQVINYRQACIDWLTAIGTPQEKIELLAPEPPEVDPTQQIFAAQQAMEAEFRNREMQTREGRLALDQAKQALDVTKAMAEQGLNVDKVESEIAKNYAQTLELLAKAGLEATTANVKNLENMFIDQKESSNGGSAEVSPSLPIPSGVMGAAPSNQGFS